MTSVVILEGANGVGKTAYAKLLSSELDAPAYRAFRGGGGTELHWGDTAADVKSKKLFKRLTDGFGIPVNTYIDDMYTADFLRMFRVSAILDRSLPSAIAYDSVDGLGESETVHGLLRWWQNCLAQSGSTLVYVWLKAPYSVAKERTTGRWCPPKSEYGRLEKAFANVFRYIYLPKVCIDTGVMDVESGVRRICQHWKS